jgi:hypothetical protein
VRRRQNPLLKRPRPLKRQQAIRAFRLICLNVRSQQNRVPKVAQKRLVAALQ